MTEAVETERRRARRARSGPPPILREILEASLAPDVLSLAIGLPSSDHFPRAELAAAAAEVLAGDPAALQYGLPARSMRQEVVELMARRGVDCPPERVLLTSGAQQAMALVAQLLLPPGGEVMLEDPVYEGIQLVVRGRSPGTVHPAPVVPGVGVDVDAVARRLAAGARPSFCYTIPEGHNPTGTSLGAADRRRLAELARRHRMFLVEDDAYGWLRYDGPGAPPLAALDDEWVIHLGTVSKILAPALRIGWIVAPEDLVGELAALKHASDVDTGSLSQHVAARFLAAGHLPGHLERLHAVYRERRDAMLSALERRLPAGAGLSWHRPEAGMFVWLELPPGVDATALARRAIDEQRVAVTPSVAFAVDRRPPERQALRLTFADVTPEEIDEGVRRLAAALAGI